MRSSSGGGSLYISTGHQKQYHQQQQQEKQKSGYHSNEWTWETDDSHLSTPMSPHMPHHHPHPHDVGIEAPRSYHEGQRSDPRIPFEKHGNADPRHYEGQRSYPRMQQEAHGDPSDRSRHNVDDMDIGYEDSPARPSFERLEHKFFDEIIKLSKEQSDAEDAENARHREKINAINTQYQEQLLLLRSHHEIRRDEYLRKESQARHQLYQQVASLDDYPSRGMSRSSDPRSYNVVAGPNAETHRTYDSGNNDGYRERGRFAGNARDHGFEPRAPYSVGSAYDHGSRYR